VITTKILVTGSTGFIGRYLLEQLARNDSLDVTAVVRPGTAGDSPCTAERSRVTHVPADLSNPYSVRLPFSEYDALINLVGPRYYRKMAQWETNVEYIRNLLVLLRRGSVKRIVHFSSISAYGLPRSSLPVTESSSLAPCDWYGVTKVLGETMLEDFHNETHVPVVVLRPSWVVGHGSHLLDRALFHAFSSGVRIVMRLGTPLNIVYVRDGADVAIQAALRPQSGLRSYIINTTQTWSFDELLREIDRATVRPKVPLVVPKGVLAVMAKRFGSLKLILSNAFFSPRRAMDDLGFAPQYDLAAIVRETLALRAVAKTAPQTR
jgi:nucleoside-diphosphate-sugar epimerase